MECSCRVDVKVTDDDEGVTTTSSIIYCPMHAAGAGMLAVLEARMTKDGGHLKMSYDHKECEAVAAVIDAARGGAA